MHTESTKQNFAAGNAISSIELAILQSDCHMWWKKTGVGFGADTGALVGMGALAAEETLAWLRIEWLTRRGSAPFQMECSLITNAATERVSIQHICAQSPLRKTIIWARSCEGCLRGGVSRTRIIKSKQAYAQPDFFVASPAPKAEQLGLGLEAAE